MMAVEKHSVRFDYPWILGFGFFVLMSVGLALHSIHSSAAILIILLIFAVDLIVYVNSQYLSKVELINLTTRRTYSLPIALYIVSVSIYVFIYMLLERERLITSLSWLVYFSLIGLSFAAFAYPMFNRYFHLREYYEKKQHENILAVTEMGVRLSELYEPDLRQNAELVVARLRGVQYELQSTSNRMAASYNSVHDFKSRFISNAEFSLVLYIALAGLVSLTTYLFSFLR